MQFRVLGPLELASGTREITPTGPKLRQVIAFLAVHRNRIVQVGELIDELWGENPPNSALSTLQTYISKTRRILADGAANTTALQTRRHGYLLEIADEDMDLCAYERLAAAGRAALEQNDNLRASVTLSEALAMWRGRALHDVAAGALMSAHITKLENDRLCTLELRVEADLRLGHHRQLVGELKGLAEMYPLHEGLHGKLMAALHRSGRRCEAVGLYPRLRAAMLAELGTEPSGELRRLHQKLLAAADGPPEPAPAGTPARPFPAADARPTAASTRRPAAPAAVTAAQLPACAPGLVGRERDLAQIKEWLRARAPEGAVPVVVINGPAGMGKTALARCAAARISGRYPAGRLYAELGGSTKNPTCTHRVLGEFLRALGVPPTGVPPEPSERSKLFRSCSADRPLLVLLDDAASADQVADLLPGSERCAVIVTGRSPGIPFGRPLPLGPLSVAAGVELLAGIAGQRRVRAERAAAERIVRSCDRLPLAVRAAGARLAAEPGRPLWHLARRLADVSHRLVELHVDGFSVLDACAASFRALSERERAIAQRFAALPDTRFTSAEAAGLLGCGAVAADALLAGLVAAHVLDVARDDGDGPVRYAFPSLAHAYLAGERASFTPG